MGIFLAGAWLAISGKGVTAGVVIVFVQLMNYILNPISQVPLLWSNRKAAIALMEKLSDALSENVREEGREKLNGFSEKIEVKDLTYGYEPESPVLKDLDVQFDAGKSYAIVGGSGSGKSTLLNLLMGSSSNYQGEICIDGVSIKNIESESLYQLMTSVQQNVFVFNDTIRNNVTMFHEFPDKEVTLALERSACRSLSKSTAKNLSAAKMARICQAVSVSESALQERFLENHQYFWLTRQLPHLMPPLQEQSVFPY